MFGAFGTKGVFLCDVAVSCGVGLCEKSTCLCILSVEAPTYRSVFIRVRVKSLTFCVSLQLKTEISITDRIYLLFNSNGASDSVSKWKTG